MTTDESELNQEIIDAIKNKGSNTAYNLFKIIYKDNNDASVWNNFKERLVSLECVGVLKIILKPAPYWCLAEGW